MIEISFGDDVCFPNEDKTDQDSECCQRKREKRKIQLLFFLGNFFADKFIFSKIEVLLVLNPILVRTNLRIFYGNPWMTFLSVRLSICGGLVTATFLFICTNYTGCYSQYNTSNRFQSSAALLYRIGRSQRGDKERSFRYMHPAAS